MEELFTQLGLVLAALIPAITAGLVYLITAGIKRLKAIKFAGKKKTILRWFAGVASFVGVVSLSLATGQEIDPAQITDIANLTITTALALFGATGIHELRNG